MRRKLILSAIILLFFLIIIQSKSFAKQIDNQLFSITVPNTTEINTNEYDYENNEYRLDFVVPFKTEGQIWYFYAYESKGESELTKADMNAEINGVVNYSNEIEEVELISIKGEMITLNGVKGYKIRYYDKWNTDSEKSGHDCICLRSDNYTYHFETYFNKDYLDSKTEKDIINSFKIKDTVKKSNNGIPFTDVPSKEWYANAVKYTYNNKMISGYNNYTFAPNDKLTRAMIVTILYRMEKSPNNDGKTTFSDVPSNEWYSKAIKWAQANKIVRGYEGTTKFGPNDNILREDLAGILRNYAKYKKKDITATGDLSKFKDYKKVDTWAVLSMKWAVGKGVITGNNNTNPPTLDPRGNATRAEAAAMIQKYCNKIGR